MTECSGSRTRGVRPHDAVHVEVVLRVPWRLDRAARLLVRHRCEQYGCPRYQEEWEEPAREVGELLDGRVLPALILPEKPCRHDLEATERGALGDLLPDFRTEATHG